jgi:hypothetical protein
MSENGHSKVNMSTEMSWCLDAGKRLLEAAEGIGELDVALRALGLLKDVLYLVKDALPKE